MEHLALGLVWLLGMPASGSPMFQQFPILKMDMAPNSFDDQYQGCSDKMEGKLKELNRTEFVPNSNYSNAWNKATAEWQRRGSQSSVLKPVQAIALMAYTLKTSPLYRQFNAAVREAGRSHGRYLHNFPFKVLHFLLTQAVHALWHAQSCCCHDVYRGVNNTIFTAKHGQTVRFGQFASTSLDRMRAETFGNDTFFSVKTCFGVPIRDFSFFPEEDEVLIPPFETFKVTSVTRKGEKTFIELQSQGVYSKYNCEFLKGKSVRHNPLRGFLLAATARATAVGI